MTQFFKLLLIIILLPLIGCNTTGQSDRVVRVDEIQTAFSPELPASEITFLLDPFNSFPGNLADSLAESLVAKAKSRQIRISRSLRKSSTYTIIGQISAVGGDNGTVILFAFDIVDLKGKRVFRINGQESTGGSSGDPWLGAHAGTFNNITEKVVSELSAWLSRAFKQTEA